MTESDDTNGDSDEDKSTNFKDEIVKQLKILNVHLERLTKYKEIELKRIIAMPNTDLSLGEQLGLKDDLRDAENIGKDRSQIGNNNK